MKKYILLQSVFIMLAMLTKAQPFTMNPDIVPTQLDLFDFAPEGKPGLKGRMNMTEVTQDNDTLYYYAKGFSIYSAGYVGISLEDKSNDIEIGLFTENWLQPAKSGNTADSGHWEKTFKVEGDFGIRVITKNKPVKYSMVVWNSKDVEVEVPSPFMYKGDIGNTGSDGFFKKNWMFIAIGILLLVVIVLLLKRKKRQ